MQIPISEFKSHLAKYVKQARSGEIIELTSHRKVVARMTGVPKTGQKGLANLHYWHPARRVGKAGSLRGRTSI